MIVTNGVNENVSSQKHIFGPYNLAKKCFNICIPYRIMDLFKIGTIFLKVPIGFRIFKFPKVSAHSFRERIPLFYTKRIN